MILALLLVDLVALNPVGWPLPTADARTPDIALELQDLSPGPVLVVPSFGPGVHPQRALFALLPSQRGLLVSPNRPGLPPELARTPAGSWLGSLAFPEQRAAPSDLSLPGVSVLLVLEPHVAAVEAVFGPPDRSGRDGAAWDLGRPTRDAGG